MEFCTSAVEVVSKGQWKLFAPRDLGSPSNRASVYPGRDDG